MIAGPASSSPALRPLPPVAARVDAALARLDAQVDWLLALSPIGGESLWVEFDRSGRNAEPELRYVDLATDLLQARAELRGLPLDQVESPLLAALLGEKQRELDRMIELVRMRDTPHFIQASLDLFGGVDPSLLELAHDILQHVPDSEPLEADAGIDEVRTAVEHELDWYRERAPDFDIDLVIDDDLNSLMMVSHGALYIDGNIRLPHARVQPLIQHEIGTHVLTRHNGKRQPLRQLEVGLAHYDPLQEGLGVLAEYLAGYLPGERLRVLAARVVATAMALRGEQVPAIFELLHAGHGLATDDAFDVAVRARRGGGLTKDALYLSGLRELLGYLHDGGDFAALFIGKFALPQCDLLARLAEQDWVAPPELLPRYTASDDFDALLSRCRETDVSDLYHLRHTHDLPEPEARAPQERTA